MKFLLFTQMIIPALIYFSLPENLVRVDTCPPGANPGSIIIQEPNHLPADHFHHAFRDRLQNCQTTFKLKGVGRVAFLGGSITAMNGWRDSICSYLQLTYPDTRFEFINAGIPSMGSTPGAFRLQKDVLGRGKVDLLFVEAAVNDRVNGFSPKTRILGMEGIVRHARESNPAMDIVFMHFVDPDKIKEYREGKIPEEIGDHEKVAAHYEISTINLAREVTDRIDHGEFSWEEDFKDLHPSPFGQQIYYRSIRTFLENCWSGNLHHEEKVKNHLLPEKLDRDSYSRGILIPAVQAENFRGWKLEPKWVPEDNANTREDFVNVPMFIRDKPGGVLRFNFEGNAVGIAVASGPDAGRIKYRIDNGKWEYLDLFTQWSSRLHLPFFFTLAYGLVPGDHSLEIKVLRGKNTSSKGQACRIRYFYVNGRNKIL